MSFAMLIIN